MHADHTALLKVCKYSTDYAEYISGLYKKRSVLKIYLVVSAPFNTDYPLKSVAKYKPREYSM